MNKQLRPDPDTVHGHWGIFGGMFDPVHRGHVTMAEDLCGAEHLVGLMLVPGVQPPHRIDAPRASFDQRSAMLRLAFSDWTNLIISDIERRITTPAYTIDVVRQLKRVYPDATFSFLIGGDQLEKFTSWHTPDVLLEEIEIVAGTRPGYAHWTSNQLQQHIKFVATRPVHVSSTRIRQAVSSGWTVDQLATLVPDAVAQYIVTNRLYQ